MAIVNHLLMSRALEQMALAGAMPDTGGFGIWSMTPVYGFGSCVSAWFGLRSIWACVVTVRVIPSGASSFDSMARSQDILYAAATASPTTENIKLLYCRR